MADNSRIEELKRRVQLDPASIAFAALAEEYRRAEQYQEAIDTCSAGLIRHPAYLSARVTLGRALMEVGRLQEEQQELEFVLKLAPENLAAIRGLAEIHHRLGDDHDGQRNGPVAAPSVTQPVEPPASAPISVAEVQAASGFIAESPQRDDARDSAFDASQAQLAGLERFLSAIQRARAERPAR